MADESSQRPLRVLFLSRRNSARSLMAAAALNRLGQGRFRAFSAGVQPASAIEPETLELLERAGYPAAELNPKHFSEFASATSEPLDLVFTLSDTAAGEPMPEWPGLPVTAHWSFPDPVLAEGNEWERKQQFAAVLSQIERRLRTFVALPFATLDRMSLKARVDELGREPG
jgi:protein-tyrosine-phosphatase